MHGEQTWADKVRYYSSVGTIYVLTLLFAWYAVHPASGHSLGRNVVLAKAIQSPLLPAAPNVTVVSGRPVRIVIPASNVDLPVDEGYYDSAQGEWTLSGYHAQYAMMSTLANNVSGNTYVYGHNNNYVFGALRHVTPAPGAQALLYTDNGHVLSYSFQKVYSVAPDDTSVFTYHGPSVLTIQTCTGSVNEWRTMFRFSFDKVVQ